MNILLVSLLVWVGLLLVLEAGLRWIFGFGNPLLYLADPEMGYLLAPNQRTKRFGNRIAINEYSMRSPTITETRPPSTLRVLLLGDSVVNGAWWTDQDRILSALMTAHLKLPILEALDENLNRQTPFAQVEVLSASANSWGPRNELAYLQRFGTFEAQAIVLLLNTDDLFAAAPTSQGVGHALNYPNRKPPCALAEVYTRYLSPQLSRMGIKAVNPKLEELRDQQRGELVVMPPLPPAALDNTPSVANEPLDSWQKGSDANGALDWKPEVSPGITPLSGLAQPPTEATKNDPLDSNLDAIRQIHSFATRAGAEFILAMTPLLREMGEPGPRDYELKARARLTQLTQDEFIHYLDFLPLFNNWDTPQRLYRDHIHLSPLGNERVSEAIARSLQQVLRESATFTTGEEGRSHS